MLHFESFAPWNDSRRENGSFHTLEYWNLSDICRLKDRVWKWHASLHDANLVKIFLSDIFCEDRRISRCYKIKYPTLFSYLTWLRYIYCYRVIWSHLCTCPFLIPLTENKDIIQHIKVEIHPDILDVAIAGFVTFFSCSILQVMNTCCLNKSMECKIVLLMYFIESLICLTLLHTFRVSIFYRRLLKLQPCSLWKITDLSPIPFLQITIFYNSFNNLGNRSLLITS